MTRITRGALAVALITAAFVATSLPVFGADNGTVDAQVTVAAPCLTLSRTTLNFGTAPLSTSSAISAATSDHNVVLANCGTGTETFYGSATNATSGAVSWTLLSSTSEINPCSATPNRNSYQVGTFRTGSPSFVVQLRPTPDNLLSGVGPGGTLDLTGKVNMPCGGSDGAGSTMTFQLNFTASF